MNKNVFIVTFQNAYNYGAILQCFALQEFLSNSENNVNVLNYDNKIISDFYKAFYFTNKNSIKQKIRATASGIIYRNRINKRNKNFRAFTKKYIKQTSKMDKEEIKKFRFPENSIFISGSDQVWNTNLTNGYDEIYFLDFNDKVKKCSYAASIGTANIDEKYIGNIKNSLNKFDNISVREETARKIINDIIDKEVKVVIDPTLLLSDKTWDKYLEQRKSEKYIFVYMENDEVIKIANYIMEKTGLKIYYICKKNIFKKNSKNLFGIGPMEFVEMIKNAEYIITTSFHATSFSVIYNKKFWVVPPKGVSSRITDFLNKIDLSNRIIYDCNCFEGIDYSRNIDYKNANMILNEERKKAIKYISEMLEG